MHHVGLAGRAAEGMPGQNAHMAGAAIAGAAVVRQLDAIHQRRVEQQVALMCGECLAVNLHVADSFPHYFTSRRIGLTWRVWRICV